MAITHQELTLELNADSAEWCPTEGQTALLAAGTYQLNEATNERDGRLYLYFAQQHGSSSWRLEPRAHLDCSGIFDMRWAPHAQPAVLALALADGTVSLVQPHAGGGSWRELASAHAAEGMVLTVDWFRHIARQGCIVASTSAGQLAVLQAGEGQIAVDHVWHGHDLEAWCVAADCWQADLVFSGSDDSSLKGWDLRQPPTAPAFVNRSTHGAGVCCLQGSPAVEHLLVTGSYDEHVRLWDLRMLHRPTCSRQVSTGGGVWRLKWHPRNPQLLLAACMHNGFAVLRLSEASLACELAVAEEYEHQRTLGYGADWCHMPDASGRSLLATCSFYDRLLHLWQPRMRYDCD